jgi:hypothetical protein
MWLGDIWWLAPPVKDSHRLPHPLARLELFIDGSMRERRDRVNQTNEPLP